MSPSSFGLKDRNTAEILLSRMPCSMLVVRPDKGR